MTVFLGADHAGTALKEAVKNALREDGYATEDVSPSTPEGGDDYPDYAFRVAEAVAGDPDARGILVCDTGIGMDIAANKVPGARAALVVNVFGATRAREHNDANILVFGSEFIAPEDAADAARRFLTTPFSRAERHVRRLGKIRSYDERRTRPPNRPPEDP